MRYLSGFVLIIALTCLIEVASRLQWLNPIYFPAPSLILITLVQLCRTGNIWQQTCATLWRAMVGYSIAMVIALPIGILMGQMQRLRYLLEPAVDILRPMPSAAVIPVAILLFGIEDRMKIAVIVFGCLWPAVLSAMDGVRGIHPLLLDTGRMLQLNRRRMLIYVVIPAALPSIVTGMRISLGIALILSVTAEMVAGGQGLGYFILDSERAFSFREMFAGIVMVGIVGYVTSRLFALADHRLLFWYYASRENGKKP